MTRFTFALYIFLLLGQFGSAQSFLKTLDKELSLVGGVGYGMGLQGEAGIAVNLFLPKTNNLDGFGYSASLESLGEGIWAPKLGSWINWKVGTSPLRVSLNFDYLTYTDFNRANFVIRFGLGLEAWRIRFNYGYNYPFIVSKFDFMNLPDHVFTLRYFLKLHEWKGQVIPDSM